MSQEDRIQNVRALMRERETARKAEDFDKSDELRERLTNEFGVKVIDQKNGPSGWKFLDGSSNKIAPGKSSTITSVTKGKKESNNEKESGKKRSASTEESADTPGKGKSSSTEASAASATQAATQASKKVKVNNEVDRNKKALGTVNQTKNKSINGVIIQDLTIGSGEMAKPGHRVQVYYIGKL